jgi:hypothetical protein
MIRCDDERDDYGMSTSFDVGRAILLIFRVPRYLGFGYHRGAVGTISGLRSPSGG